MRRLIFTVILIFSFCLVGLGQMDEIPCPKLEIEAHEPEGIRKGDLISFIILINGKTDPKFLLNWKIWKDGRLTQMTASSGVTVDTTGISNLKVSVERANPENCKNPTAASIGIGIVRDFMKLESKPIDSYDKKAWADEKARLDNFAVAAKSNRDYAAYIVFQFDRKAGQSVIRNRLKRIFDHLARTHKIDKRRVLFTLLYGDSEKTRLFIVPPGASFPDAGAKEGQIVNGVELEKLFSKKSNLKIYDNRNEN